MIGSVVLYKHTGLDTNNVLDNGNILATVAPNNIVSGGSIAIKQDRGLTYIRLDKTYDEVKDVDYAEINNQYYFVIGCVMINDNCAELTLLFDAITTVSTNGFSINSGMITRCHVNEDKPFTNTIPEPFEPTNNFELKMGGIIEGSTGIDKTENKEYMSLILATADISQEIDTAKFYEGIYGGISQEVIDLIKDKLLGICIANIPLLQVYTQYGFDEVDEAETTKQYFAYVAQCAVFDGTKQEVQKGCKALNELGLDNVILYAYMLPGMYIKSMETADENEALISQVKTINENIQSNTEIFSKGQFKNAKVWSGQFQTYNIISNMSGDTMQFSPEDVYHVYDQTQSSIYVRLKLTADARYNGYPIVYPRQYKNSPNTAKIGLVRGAKWEESPLKFYGRSGSELQYQIQQKELDRNFGRTGRQTTMNTIGTTANIVTTQNTKSGLLSGGLNLFNNIASMYDNGLQYANNQYIHDFMKQVPDIKFMPTPEFADYFGNVFYDYVIRMSFDDMTRFDNFLTQNGYAVYETFKSWMFNSREHFNYLQGENISISSECDQYTKNIIKAQIEGGVRIWHEMPNVIAMTDNPIVGG